MNTAVKDDADFGESPDVSDVCRSISDFYTPNAREAVARQLASFLVQQVITPVELLHSGKYLKRLNDAGRTLSNAVDKVATVQSKTTKQSPVQRLRDLNELVSTGIRKAWDEDKDRPPPSVTPETFLAVTARIPQASPDRNYQINRILTEFLLAYKTWKDKAEILVTLADICAGEPEQALIEAILAECIKTEPCQDQLFGFAERQEDRCNDLISLWQGNWVPRDSAQPVLSDIARMVNSGTMPDLKTAIEVSLLRIVVGRDPLRSMEPELELQAIFELFRRMWSGGALIGGAKALAAFERRQARILSTEGVTDMLRERKVVADRMAFLMVLAGTALGLANRATIKSFITHYFGDADFIPRVLSGNEPAMNKMQALGGIYRSIKNSWLDEDEKTVYMAKVEAAQVDLMRKARILEQIKEKGAGPAQKVMALLDLCRKNSFTEGVPMDAVRALIRSMINDPRFLPDFLGDAQGEERGKKMAVLTRTLASLGILVSS